MSELVNDVGETVTTGTSYGSSMHLQRKCTGNLIDDCALMIEILSGIILP
jgi:hypothetical protein